MAFDPSLPADHSPNSSAEMRAQLTALKALIDAQAVQIAALQAAFAGTAQNPSLGTLSLSLDDPPTRPQVQAVVDQVNTMLTQITRV